MARRRVIRTFKNQDGDIIALCNPGRWRRTKDEVINDIERGQHSYYVHEAGEPVDIHVVERHGVKHLRTNPDSHPDNNLDALRTC